MKRIYLDLDNVLVDFVGGIYKFFGVPPGFIDQAVSATVKPDMMPEVLGVNEHAFWSRIGENPGFWDRLEWLPWGRELLDICNEFAPTYITTKTLSWHPETSMGKHAWLDRVLPDQDFLIVGGSKGPLGGPGSLLIDDLEENCNAFEEHGGTAILFPARWNSKRGACPWSTLSEINFLLERETEE